MKQHHRVTVALALLLALGAASATAADKPVATKKKPVATRHAAKKPAVKAAAKKPVPVAKAAKPKKADPSPAPTARATPKPPATHASARPAAPKAAPAKPLPAPQAATFIPLGPERFYPNGIPELRPEFLHPLPDQQLTQRREAVARETVAEERRSWFAAPQ